MAAPHARDPRLRDATAGDLPGVVDLVHELAVYEKLPEQCRLTVDALRRSLFAPRPAVFCTVAAEQPGGPPAGYAMWFLSYSTWEGVHGIYLEDLYVRPQSRGSGLGKAMLTNLFALAADRGYARVEWSVLDWNTPSIDFYRALGAVPMDGWQTMRYVV